MIAPVIIASGKEIFLTMFFSKCGLVSKSEYELVDFVIQCFAP